MATELATAYVSIVPSAKGIAGNIARELAPVETAATTTGARAGRNLSGGILSQLPGGAKLAGALGFAAIGVAAFKAASDVDEAYDTIRIGTGKTGKALEGLQGVFRDVVSDVPAGFGDASAAVADLNKRLGITGPMLKERSEQFLELAHITGTDVKQDITDITRVFGDWSIKTGDQGRTLDKLFRATQVTGVGINDLAQNVVQFGSPLRNLGFTFDQSVAMFARFAREGVNIQTVLAGLRFGLKTFAKAGEEPIDALRRVIDQIKNAGSTAEANSLAFQVFGTRAGPDMAAAIREGRFELDPLIKAIANGKDTVLGAAKDTADVAESYGRLRNQAKLLLADIGKPIFAIATDSAEKAIPVVHGLADVLNLVKPAIGPVVVALGTFYGTSKLLVPIVGLLNSGIQGLGQAMLNRGFGADGTAVQGLASVANAGQRLQANLPKLAAGATLLGIGLSQAGDGGTQGAMGIGEMAVGGAMLGQALIPIPGLGLAAGAAIGGLTGAVMHFTDTGPDVAEYRKQFVSLADTIDQVGSKQAAKQFIDQLGDTDRLKLAKGDLRGIKDELQALASQSPDAANKVVAGFKAMRGESGKPLFTDAQIQQFDDFIDKQITKTQQAAQHKRDAASANQQLQASETNMAGAADDSTSSLNDQIAALQNLQSVTLGQQNAQLGYVQAVAAVDKAQQSLNDAVAQYGPDSQQARDANLALIGANNQLAGATLTLDQATAQLDATYTGHLPQLDADIQRLKDQQAQYPQSAAAIQPLIDKLEAERQKLVAVQGEYAAHVTVTISDYASERIAGLRQEFANLAAMGFTSTQAGEIAGLNAIPRAVGGPVWPGQAFLVGEHGPELLIPNAAGTMIPAGPTAAAMSTASAQGKGGLVIEHATFGTTDVVPALDYWAQVKGAGG